MESLLIIAVLIIAVLFISLYATREALHDTEEMTYDLQKQNECLMNELKKHKEERDIIVRSTSIEFNAYKDKAAKYDEYCEIQRQKSFARWHKEKNIVVPKRWKMRIDTKEKFDLAALYYKLKTNANAPCFGLDNKMCCITSDRVYGHLIHHYTEVDFIPEIGKEQMQAVIDGIIRN